MQINFKDLKKLRNKYYNKNIIICAGWFDMFHVGHLAFLNNAKKHGDILVVVVMNDQGIKPIKGLDRPIINEKQRITIVDNIKCVDYTILSSPLWNIKDLKKSNKIGNNYKEQLLWQEYLPIISELKPQSIFTLKETINYKSILNFLNKNNLNIIYTNYYNKVSTTQIINTLNK